MQWKNLEKEKEKFIMDEIFKQYGNVIIAILAVSAIIAIIAVLMKAAPGSPIYDAFKNLIDKLSSMGTNALTP